MKILVAAVCLFFGFGFATRAASPETAAVPAKTSANFVAGISPFLDASAKDPVYRGLVRLIVNDLPLGAKFEVYDAYNLKSITRLSIPNSKVFNSPKTRANQFASAIGEIRRFLAQTNARPDGSKADFNGAIRFPQFCDFLAENEEADSPQLLIGSPLYQDAKEPAFSMADGYFPSDGHLRVSREESIFGFNAANVAAGRTRVYWMYFGDPWQSDLHREKVERFWALYLERRGGRLASFSADLATVLSAFSTEAPGAAAASKGWVVDTTQTRPEMIRASRNMQKADWLTGDPASDLQPPPPSQMTGPIKIGIRWKKNIDLDLYATPRPGADTLFFQNTRSPEGYYFMDHRSSPGREYEFIEFESPVDVREVRSSVNFYAGECPGGPRGEVRIEYQDRIYRGAFAIKSSEGNKGRSGSSQSRYWTEIPIQEILGIRDARSGL